MTCLMHGLADAWVVLLQAHESDVKELSISCRVLSSNIPRCHALCLALLMLRLCCCRHRMLSFRG